MFARNTFVLAAVAPLALLFTPAELKAQDWEQYQESRFQKEDDVEGTAEVWARPVKKLGRDMIEFKIKITTKTIGRNRTGRAYATFAIVDKNDKPMLVLQAAKYASTSPFQKEHEESEESTTTISAKYYDEIVDSGGRGALDARTTAKVDFPMTTKDGVKWFKDNIAPGMADALNQVKGQGAGEKIAKDNWIVWKLKKGLKQ